MIVAAARARPSDAPQAGARTFVVFDVDARRVALPLEDVERVYASVALTPVPRGPAILLGVVDVHGQALPVLDLRARLGAPSRLPRVNDRLLVARLPARPVLLPVDRVEGLVEVTPDQIVAAADLLADLPDLEGVACTQEGILLLLDLARFLSLDDLRSLAREVPP